MIAVIGRPTECDLRKVARTNDKTVRIVGDIHDDLCAFTRLCVFIGYVAHVFIVSDILKMHADGAFDIHGANGRAERFREHDGVALCANGRTEARHGNGDDIFSVASEKVHRANGNEERKRGVKTARNANDGSFRVCMGKTLFQTIGLDIQNTFRTFSSLLYTPDIVLITAL